MTETSKYWDGISTGDAGPYSSDEFNDWFQKVVAAARETQGVIRGYGNELALSNPAGTTVRVASGAAIVDGTFYESDDDIDLTVSVPGAGTVWYTVVLRKDWSSQTVRAVLLGPGGTPPSPTQVDGTTWELPIGDVSVDSGGTVDVNWYDTHGVNASIALGLQHRQGGDDNDWMSPGTTNYDTPGGQLMCGSYEWTGVAAASGSFTIDFPRAFLYVNAAQRLPLVFVQAINNSNVGIGILYPDANTNYGQVRIEWTSISGSTYTSVIFAWMAIGEGTFPNYP